MTTAAAAAAQGDTKVADDTSTKTTDDAAAKAAADTAAADAAKATADKATADAAAAAGKKDDSQKPGGKADEAQPQSKAPEKYALKVPDGGEAHIAADDLAYIENVGRANNWTNDEAQAEIDKAVELGQKRETARSEKLLGAFKADKDYGGDNFGKTQLLAEQAVNRVFPEGHRYRDEFLKTMNIPTVKNNVVFSAFLAEIGTLMAEDTGPGGRSFAAAGTKKDPADVLYPAKSE